MTPSIEVKALLPTLIIQCLIAIIVIVIAGAAIPLNRAELVKYRNREFGGKHIFAPFIKTLGPENYPLLYASSYSYHLPLPPVLKASVD